MDSTRTKNLIHHLFYVIAAIALVLNGFSDYFAYRENQISDQLGDQVREVILAEKALDAFERSMHEERPAEKLEDSKSELQKYAVGFSELNRVLSFYNQTGSSSHELNQIIRGARLSLDEISDKRRVADRDQNIKVEKQLASALIFDFILMVLMLGLFILNLLIKRRIEFNLRQSQKSLMNSLLVLEEQAIKRKITTKSVIHDLRNPIGTIMGFAELMREESASPQSIIEASERIQKISERSLLLVESLLNENEEPFTFTEVDINNIAKEVCARLKILADAKDQKLELISKAISYKILGNEIKLEEVFTNLIDNAIKYSPKGVTIGVSIVENPSTLQFVVKDQGPGFSSEDKLRAFQFGTRLSARPTGNERSSGIGLFVVKGIIDSHRSKISIEDNLDGVGSSLVVTFPKPLNDSVQHTIPVEDTGSENLIL